MLRLGDILNRLDHERRYLVSDGQHQTLFPALTRVSAAGGSHHSIAWSNLTDQSADAAIANEIEHHRQLNVSFEWKLYAHDTPSDLLQRLERHGLQIGPLEAVLVYDLAAPDVWITAGPASRVDRIDHVEQVAIYQSVAEQIFHKDYSFTANELADALRSNSTHHRGYIGYCGDQPVSIGRLYTHPASHFAGLYGGATLPDHRHQGHYRSLIAARAQDAVAAQAHYLLVDALPTSCPILQRLGFQHLVDTWPCEWSPSST